MIFDTLKQIGENMNQKYAYVVLLGGCAFEKQFDTEKEARDYVDYCHRFYVGVYIWVKMTNDEFMKFMRGHMKFISTPNGARGLGTLATRQLHYPVD
jgi:hypothetical protein